MDHRYNAISEAHAQTLQWLLDPTGSSQLSGDSFARWLQHDGDDDDRLYWVHGKPGSGKSTVMRYLNDHQQTQTLVRAWSKECDLVTASCYFWVAGASIQKSLRGMLQTLLYQLVRAKPKCVPQLFPDRYTLICLDGQPEGSWSVSELRTALLQYARLYAPSTALLLTVDGLDEFDGTDHERREVCALLLNMAKKSNVKVCVSSRAWNVYEDAFSTAPQLCIELLTRNDITVYVEDKLLGNAISKQWYAAEPTHAREVIAEVVRKAEGVFLWVRLVVRDLLEGTEQGDDIHEMTRILSDTPSDLEALFDDIPSRIEDRNKDSAYRVFQFVLHGQYPIMMHYFSHNAAVQNERHLPEAQIQQTLENRQLLEERRINARSLGLLQFDILGSHTPPFQVVSFMHRTARDFVSSSYTVKKMEQWKQTPFDVNTAVIESCSKLLTSYNWYRVWSPQNFNLSWLSK